MNRPETETDAQSLSAVEQALDGRNTDEEVSCQMDESSLPPDSESAYKKWATELLTSTRDRTLAAMQDVVAQRDAQIADLEAIISNQETLEHVKAVMQDYAEHQVNVLGEMYRAMQESLAPIVAWESWRQRHDDAVMAEFKALHEALAQRRAPQIDAHQTDY